VCSTFEAELADAIPVVKTSIGGTRIIGRLCAGKDLLFSLLFCSLVMSYKEILTCVIGFGFNGRKQKWTPCAAYYY
jgi:hypothetical protein